MPDASDILAELRAAKQDWINCAGHDCDETVWRIVEAFETLDALLTDGRALPEDWKLPVRRTGKATSPEKRAAA